MSKIPVMSVLRHPAVCHFNLTENNIIKLINSLEGSGYINFNEKYVKQPKSYDCVTVSFLCTWSLGIKMPMTTTTHRISK